MACTLEIPTLFNVSNQVVVITGGGSGLGKILATAFAINGAKVYITGRRKQVLEESAKEINGLAEGKSGGKVIACVAILSRGRQWKEMIDILIRRIKAYKETLAPRTK